MICFTIDSMNLFIIYLSSLSRYFSQQNLKAGIRATDTDSSEPDEKPRLKKSSSSRYKLKKNIRKKH